MNSSACGGVWVVELRPKRYSPHSLSRYAHRWFAAAAAQSGERLHFPMLAERAGDLLHRLDVGTHGLAAPLVEPLALTCFLTLVVPFERPVEGVCSF